MLMTAKKLTEHLTIEQLFQRYQVVTELGEQQANTLTLKLEEYSSKHQGICPI